MPDGFEVISQLQSESAKHVISGHASQHTRFTLNASGPLGPKELKNIIVLLTAQIEILEDDEAGRSALSSGGEGK